MPKRPRPRRDLLSRVAESVTVGRKMLLGASTVGFVRS